MDAVLADMGMGFAMTLIIAVAATGAALGFLSEPAAALGQRAGRGILRRRLADTLMPGMLARQGVTLAGYCEDHSPAELRTALDRCRNCRAKAECRAEQVRMRGGPASFEFCPNRNAG